MKIQKNYDLSKLNTFGIKAQAKLFVEVNSEEELKELFTDPVFIKNRKLFLGGGSNTLFTKDFDGIVVLNKLQGIEILKVPTPEGIGIPTESVGKDEILVRSMGGVMWHDLVILAVNHGYWGIENLALIPGTVGAAPMQNIGAYGAELKDTLFNVEAFEIETGKKKIFSKKECELGYRDSVFKNKFKEKYFISAVTLKLNKKPARQLAGGEKEIYPVLKDYLAKNKIKVQNSKNISDAVAEIRKSKLPDPKIIGNAGSFFKNVFIEKTQLQTLQKVYPNMPYFEEDLPAQAGEAIKIPAGWLIEQCGWKGHRLGNVGVHEKQALILVNHGGATGREVVELADKIITSVKEKFSLELVPEVNIV